MKKEKIKCKEKAQKSSSQDGERKTLKFLSDELKSNKISARAHGTRTQLL